MAESMAQGFVGGPGVQWGQFPFNMAPEHLQALVNSGALNPEMQHLLQPSVTQVRCGSLCYCMPGFLAGYLMEQIGTNRWPQCDGYLAGTTDCWQPTVSREQRMPQKLNLRPVLSRF